MRRDRGPAPRPVTPLGVEVRVEAWVNAREAAALCRCHVDTFRRYARESAILEEGRREQGSQSFWLLSAVEAYKEGCRPRAVSA